jgi:hypothetical protein
VKDPAVPVTAGWYDSSDDSLFAPGSYDGVWAVYPYYWSGKITAGDMQNGLYVFMFDSLAPRTPASLLGPADGVTACDNSPVAFRWTRVGDPVKDPHEYWLRIAGGSLDTLIRAGSDTSITLEPDSLGFGTFEWSVITKDEANQIATQDTFTFHHPWRTPVVLSPNGGEVLKTGTEIAVTWSSSCVDSVEISYSANGGATWTVVAPALAPLPANFLWTVPFTPSIHARLRIRSLADTALADVSDAEFTLYNSQSITLLSPNGGEVWRSGTFHEIAWTSGLVTHIAVELSTDAGSSWSTVVADTPAAFGAIPWYVPNQNGALMLVRVTDLDNSSVSDESDAVFTIWPMTMDLAESWNLVSFPGLPADPLASANFPGASSALFRFADGYAQQESVETGAGYWVKFDTARTIPLSGTPVSRDTVEVSGRWNMIGAVSVPVAVSALTPDPGTMTLSTVYGYAPDSGYYAADSIRPGKGYWVKASESGRIIVSGTPGASALAPAKRPAGDIVVFTDAAGRSRSLLSAGPGEELPPPPPAGSFDVRFASQRSAEMIGANGAAIEIRSAVYPVAVTVHASSGTRYRLVERVNGAARASYPLSAGETVLTARVPGALSIETIASGFQPRSVALRQNWPNPFNPVTTITFDLLGDARVSLKVYSLLGAEVGTLVDGIVSAGSHSVAFDAKDLPSGVYLCRLRTESGTETRKMVLAR